MCKRTAGGDTSLPGTGMGLRLVRTVVGSLGETTHGRTVGKGSCGKVAFGESLNLREAACHGRFQIQAL